MSDQLVVDDYDTCAGLKELGTRLSRPMNNYKSTQHGKNNVVNASVVCQVQPNDPMCKVTGGSTTQKVRKVQSLLAGAQQRGVRSVELARKSSMERMSRYDRAQCERRLDEVTQLK